MNATLSDGGILRALGLALARDEHGVARPVVAPPLSFTPIVWRRCGWCHWILGVVAVERPALGMFTDTICPGCRAKFFAQERRAA